MIDPRTLRVLEFDKIKTLLRGLATSSLGAELADRLAPATDLEEARALQAETTEARGILRLHPGIPLGGVRDVREAVRRARIGSTLEPGVLLDIAHTLAAARKLRRFLLELREDFKVIAGLAGGLKPPKDLEDAVFECIDENGELYDSASPRLKHIRAGIRSLNGRIRDRLDSLIRSSETQRYLQDAIITIRNDRFVVPVKQEFRSYLPGIVHDQSASGQTLFIEPMPVVDMNNRLRELCAEEREEIARILGKLSAKVASAAGALDETLETLGRIDFAFAKARMSEELDAVEPELNGEGHINIRKGRHPLLKGDVVPIDPSLGREFSTMVITGPNTGGKTVTLKTIGLLTLMAQAGLHVPADYGTTLAVFSQVFADIGDEQSIEQSLSTFSSHMTHIVRILREAGDNSLVLLDELGAGTDPQEGAALAMAILEYLHDRNARTVATTHYSELKTFAYRRDGVRNASVEFDDITLRPTYRLLIGLPGRSNAFAIASRLGLPDEVIARARSMMAPDATRVEDMIADIAENMRSSELQRRDAEALRVRAEQLKREHEEEARRVREKRAEIIEKAREEARQILRKARLQAEETIRAVRELERKASLAGKARTELEDAIREIREGLENASGELLDGEEAYLAPADGDWQQGAAQGDGAGDMGLPLSPDDPDDARAGVVVFVPRFKQQGCIVAGPNARGEVQVQIGVVKVMLPMGELLKVADTGHAATAPAGLLTPATRGPHAQRQSQAQAQAQDQIQVRAGVDQISREKAREIATELDLRGLRVEDALERVDKYLDDAILAGLPRARIIHGKGTGALRQAVREYLKNHSGVAGFRFGEAGEGGDGVTVVSLCVDGA
ncbi:MAG: endonuclease MutS2 [Firmicutes bacterium]|nr:endonuclease MutS2 [Bacillota bacterium]